MNIGFIGNFIPPYSTENDRKWSFEKLGHKVIIFQENKTKAPDLIDAISKIDVLFYSHTHDPNYIIPELKEVFKFYKKKGIPTASVHLDRWAWLKRVEDIGEEATWFTEYVFMADGSPEAEELYKRYDLNWYFIKPGVIERDCYMAKPDHKRFPHEIVFTGSKGYHPEYPLRPKLIDWLHKSYGNHFGHYGNDGLGVVRGKDLNVLYASAKVIIGDSCFTGRPYYVSDRYFEVRGRGGLLMHPHREGFDTKGVINYDPLDFNSIAQRIEVLLEDGSDIADGLRIKGHDWVKNNETYTHRAKEMLDIIFK